MSSTTEPTSSIMSSTFDSTSTIISSTYTITNLISSVSVNSSTFAVYISSTGASKYPLPETDYVFYITIIKSLHVRTKRSLS